MPEFLLHFHHGTCTKWRWRRSSHNRPFRNHLWNINRGALSPCNFLSRVWNHYGVSLVNYFGNMLVNDLCHVPCWLWVLHGSPAPHVRYGLTQPGETLGDHIIAVVFHLRRSSQVRINTKDYQPSIAFDHFISRHIVTGNQSPIKSVVVLHIKCPAASYMVCVVHKIQLLIRSTRHRQ